MFLTLGGGGALSRWPGLDEAWWIAPRTVRTVTAAFATERVTSGRYLASQTTHTALLRVANYLSQIFVVKWRTCDFVQEITNISFVTYLELTW